MVDKRLRQWSPQIILYIYIFIFFVEEHIAPKVHYHLSGNVR